MKFIGYLKKVRKILGKCSKFGVKYNMYVKISSHAYANVMNKFLKKIWKYFKETLQTFEEFF